MIFNYPWVLWIGFLSIVVLIGLLYLNIFGARNAHTQAFSTQSNSGTKLLVIYQLPLFFLLISILFAFIALAQPIKPLSESTHEVEGISIMMVIDLSGSMEAEDFKPKNRFTVAQQVLQNFIQKRQYDLIGSVVFGTEAFLLSPLTSNKPALLRSIAALRTGQIDGQTAIGDAIIKAVNHLKKAPTETKIIILLTDGENNAGDMDPITASRLAAAVNIKIYTIGVGKIGGAPIPYTHPAYGKQYFRNPDGSLFLTKLDEPTLKEIASITNGLYFRAVDKQSLAEIYDYIDQLERTEIEWTSSSTSISEHELPLTISLLFLFVYLVSELVIWRTLR